MFAHPSAEISCQLLQVNPRAVSEYYESSFVLHNTALWLQSSNRLSLVHVQNKQPVFFHNIHYEGVAAATSTSNKTIIDIFIQHWSTWSVFGQNQVCFMYQVNAAFKIAFIHFQYHTKTATARLSQIVSVLLLRSYSWMFVTTIRSRICTACIQLHALSDFVYDHDLELLFETKYRVVRIIRGNRITISNRNLNRLPISIALGNFSLHLTQQQQLPQYDWIYTVKPVSYTHLDVYKRQKFILTGR